MTFNLKEFKRLAGERTKGKWHLAGPTFDSDEHSVIEAGSHNIAMDVEDNDAEFIAYCGTHADAIIERIEKLEKVVAALRWYFEIDESEMKYFNPKYFPAYHAGKEALKALEERGE